MERICIAFFIVFFIASCSTSHKRVEKTKPELEQETFSEPVGKKFKFIIEDVSAKYSWENPKGFGGGYFDVLYENGMLFAVPSNFANGLGEFETDVDSGTLDDCARTKPKALDYLIEISGYPKNMKFGRNINIRNSNILGEIKDVEIDGEKGWYKLTPKMAGQNSVFRWQVSLCYQYNKHLTTPVVMTEGQVISLDVLNYDDLKNTNQRLAWSRNETRSDDLFSSRIGDLVLFKFADDIRDKVFRSDAEKRADMIRYMADLLAEEMLRAPSKPVLEMPVLESKPPMPTLSKNEFETSAEFEIRKNGVLKEWKDKISNIEREHLEKISLRNDMLQKLELEHAEKLKLLEEPSYRASIYNKAIERAITSVLGRPVFKNVMYDADAQTFSAKVVSAQFPDFFFDVKIPVEKDKAVSYKKKMLSGLFYPKILLNSDFTLFSAGLAVDEARENAEYEFALKSQSPVSFDLFLERYPDSKFFKTVLAQKKALIDKNENKRLEQLQEKESRERAERDKYFVTKQVGDSVCKPARVAFGLIGVTIKAFVEQSDGSRIKLRISSTEGQSIHYNGSQLSPGVVIWDDHYEWKKCQ